MIPSNSKRYFSRSINRAVRRAFDRVLDKRDLHQAVDLITLDQCQRALHMLSFAQNMIHPEHLKEIVLGNRDIGQWKISPNKNHEIVIDFDEFCMVVSYLTILQQEINDSGCISPIKGTNLPPPPIFLTNTLGKSLRSMRNNEKETNARPAFPLFATECVGPHQNDLTNRLEPTYRSNHSKSKFRLAKRLVLQ